MKKPILFIALALMLVSFGAKAQNKAFKVYATDEEPVYNITHVEECPSTAVYRGDEGHDPDSAMLINADGPWTVEAWVFPDRLGMNYLFISGGNTQLRLQHFTEHPGEWWLGTDFNAVGLGTLGQLGGGEWDDVFGDPGYIAEEQEWQHFAVVFDEYSIRLLVNGEDEYYYTNFHNVDEDYTGYDAMAWGIGDNETGWMPTASCEIDNYRVWDKVRTNEEILADMKKVVPENTDGLIANYTFDADTEGKVINQAGDTRNMVINEESVAAVSYVESTAPREVEGIFENNSIVNVSVYPNPASDFIMVEGSFDKNANAAIMDITGKLIQSTLISNNRIDLPNLEAGLYFVKISDNSKIYTAKVSIK